MSIRSDAPSIARPARLGAAALGLALGAAMLTGCSVNTLETYDLENDLGPAHDLRYDPSPEAYTLYQRPSDMRNQVGLMYDENVRMMRQDFHRAFFLDRPSRLTREPVPR